jgi:uncharacterized protein (DUF1501 family)
MTWFTNPLATRRQFLGSGVVGALGLALSPAMQRLLAAQGPGRRAKACILVWLNGGPSHIDTFDPKPGAPTGGPFKAIDTSVPGLRLCEHFPKLARQAKHLAVLRSLTSPEADHDRAVSYLHTGNRPQDTVDYPALGSVVAAEWGPQAGDLPPFITIHGNAAAAGFLGIEHAPHAIADVAAPLANISLPKGVDEARLARRMKALDRLNKEFSGRSDGTRVEEVARSSRKAESFRRSAALRAFDLTREPQSVLTAYGANLDPPKEGEEAPPTLGRALLLARRLVEQGVPFVEVFLDGWDTHEKNFPEVQRLCGLLDPALAALLGDLHVRGLLEETLVLCLGEFGRTPVINATQGRDHHAEVFSAVLAGGGVKGGQVIGKSDDKGEKVKDRPVTVPDLYATLLTLFGLKPDRTYQVSGRPIKLADKGTVVREVTG